jgi:hypothetical protein
VAKQERSFLLNERKFPALRGRTIKSAKFAVDTSSSDGNWPTFEMDFEDGSFFSLQLAQRDPEIEALFTAPGEDLLKAKKTKLL